MKFWGAAALIASLIPPCVCAKTDFPPDKTSIIPSSPPTIIPGFAPIPDAARQAVPAKTISQIPSSAPTIDPSWQSRDKQKKRVHDFFRLFGWIRRNATIHEPQMPSAIRKIQRVLRVPETGEYNERMERVMSRPRCGTEAAYNESEATIPDGGNRKRFVLWGPKWNRNPITYRFINYTNDLPENDQRSLISNAFAQWTQYLPLKISPTPTNNARADIHIRFVPLGPSEPAYAYTNMIADGTSLSSGLINITFNDDYAWDDTRLFNFTAVHEIGHALGLSHSKVEDAIMWPYYEGLIRPMNPDDIAAVHSLYGWRDPRWSMIDNKISGSKFLIEVSTPFSDQSLTPPSPLDGLYQMRSSGQVLSYNPTSKSWTTIDSNKDTVQIAGAAGSVFQRHSDGSVFRYTGSGQSWTYIGPASDNVLDIVASAGDQVYQRRKDGWIARWTGSGSSWTTIEQPRNSRQIAVTDSRILWNLLSNGDLVRSQWPHNVGWTIVDINSLNLAIAVGGNEFYKLQSDNIVVWLDSVLYYWKVIDDEGDVVSIYAVGIFLYARRKDGSVWRYTGTPGVWEMLDDKRESEVVIGDRRGGVWEMVGGGDVLRLVS
ncbi:hypothetical protein B0J11DRAFT_315941 [Dendryphion nanum]|uniref:Peptidase metallopeptidase domain-containing protein n=1 Tax=Dendryphion nanum TaxID=256645 RepID=A0A9P9DRC0_9PLEO|nr:hypothetical protein B0J11DRAFT_315941 [Dendryphion nanum]